MLLIGYPGKAVGASIQATGLALLGVCVGSVFFVILAELAPSPVAQGFVFAITVYIFALVKAQGLKWFSFALLAILVAFNGIYTSYVVALFFVYQQLYWTFSTGFSLEGLVPNT